MLKVGAYNSFRVTKGTSRGWHIESGGETLFVPKKMLPPNTIEGHLVKLFVYNKGRDEIRATSDTPLAVVDEFAYLKVKDITNFGLFMEWGIDKDLFIPRRFVKEKPEKDSSLVVRLLLDEDNRSVIGSCLLEDFIKEKPDRKLMRGQQANILIYGIKDIGFRVIVNNKYRGMLYKDENSHLVRFGEKKQGYIVKIRPDGLIDVSLEKQPKSEHTKMLQRKKTRS